jgi:hypothetical protein
VVEGLATAGAQTALVEYASDFFIGVVLKEAINLVYYIRPGLP